MSIWRKYSRFHWQVFNIGVRLFGVISLLAVAVAITSAIDVAVHPPAATTEQGALPAYVADAMVGLFLLGIAIPLLRVPTYRPDLGDSAWSFKGDGKTQLSSQRSWWTGEPKRP